MENLKEKLYTVGEVAKMLNLSNYTVRYYTNLGLVPYIKRDANNNRLFNEEDIYWLKGFIKLKKCGMSVKNMQKYCRLCLQGGDTFNERYAMICECRKKAQEKFENARQILDFAENKLQHYNDIKAGKVKDNTNLLFR